MTWTPPSLLDLLWKNREKCEFDSFFALHKDYVAASDVSVKQGCVDLSVSDHGIHDLNG